MIQCSNCQGQNLSDSPLCANCRPLFHFVHRADCVCDACGAQVVEINGLSEPTEYAFVDENFRPIDAGIDADYEAWQAARESMEGVIICSIV